MKWLTLATLTFGVGIIVCSLSKSNQYRTSGVGNLIASVRQQSPRQTHSTASFNTATIEIGGGEISIEFAPGDVDLTRSKLIAWVSAAALAVSDYYGHFPVKKSLILIVPVEGTEGVLSGTSWGTRPATSRIYLGQHATEEDLKNDWVMTHEMVHYAFPAVSAEHHWIEEGIATYVEPIARLKAGQLPAAKVWDDLVKGLPLGLPGPEDAGLDYTHTWGRTYWGGAMFCMLADIRIRRETGNHYGLRDALRAIVADGGNIETAQQLADVLAIGDRAVGGLVLQQLYNEMKATPVVPDLGLLWEKLGVEIRGPGLEFNDRAPWADTRRAIATDQ